MVPAFCYSPRPPIAMPNLFIFFFLGCAVANQAIWCYGGATGINGAQLTSKTSTLTKLDMSNYDFFNLQFNWQIVTPNNFVLEENWLMSMTSAQNETGLFIFGGMGLGSAPVNPVITYNGQSNTWKGTTTLPTDWNNTYPFLPAVVDLSSIGRTQAWIWGGAINGTDTGISPNVQLFDYNANTWSSSAQATPGGSIRYYHTASLSNDGASIFVLGGTSMRPGQVGESPIDMTEVWVFSTANGQWITVTGSSDTKLLGRQYHTAVTSKLEKKRSEITTRRVFLFCD
ncbi:hypothetical protein BC940DRAFT_55853 [Gongronella butleri]|nr:hypothetical protein BC940DRAFT_55853 [Gongronella butleri]